MPERDFFAFCTTLKPVERRAVGELSYVRRAGAGETIYPVGAAADTLYIINRGVIELAGSGATTSVATTYLSRGDVFGDIETLTATQRRHTARAHLPVSLQSFELRDFPELIERVPAFFIYLGQQLAGRLVRAVDAASAETRCLELSGNLANFDLITVYQTIVNSAQTGELAIRGEDGDLICTFFFEAGQPRCGQFQHLTGEEAFWQLFLDETLSGSFSFAAGSTGVSHSTEDARITRHPSDMLINALQYRDEFQVLQEEAPAGSVLLGRTKSLLRLDQISPSSLQPQADELWRLLAAKPLSVAAVYQQLAVSQLTVLRLVQELVRTGHVVVEPRERSQKVA